MALASNLPAARPRPASPAIEQRAGQAGCGVGTDQHRQSALVSCAELLASPSALTQSVAADLVQRRSRARPRRTGRHSRAARRDADLAGADCRSHAARTAGGSRGARTPDPRHRPARIDAPSDCQRARLIKVDVRLVVTRSVGAGRSDSRAHRCHRATATASTATRGRPPPSWCASPAKASVVILSVDAERGGVAGSLAGPALRYRLADPRRRLGPQSVAGGSQDRAGHGGDLDVDSAEGGTIFTLTLPSPYHSPDVPAARSSAISIEQDTDKQKATDAGPHASATVGAFPRRASRSDR